jgi:hypothetical protein
MNEAIYTKTIKHPKYDHLEVTFEALDETESPEDHFEMQDDIDFASDFNNEAAWFNACVKVQIKGTHIFGMDFLGCCSYKSFDEFMKEEYFTDMIEEATNDLINDLNDLNPKIESFIDEYNKAS